MIIKNNKVSLEVGDKLEESLRGGLPSAVLKIDRVTMEHAYCGDKKFSRKTPMTTVGNAYPERLDDQAYIYRIIMDQNT